MSTTHSFTPTPHPEAAAAPVAGLCSGAAGAHRRLRSRTVRDEWQEGWPDDVGDSCNTREEVLLAEPSTPAQVGPGCPVLAGHWADRYTGRQLTSPSDLQIDHLVSATPTEVGH